MPAKACPSKAANEQTCSCPSTDCERHGVCCECLRESLAANCLPACLSEVAEMKNA